MQAVSVPLSELERLSIITTNPAKKMKKIAEKPTKREILISEVKKLFSASWPDKRLLYVNKLAACTGMRLGECRGLLKKSVFPEEISIESNWIDGEGLKGPKLDSYRRIPIPSIIYEKLHELIEFNPWNNNFVFYGKSRGRPISKEDIENSYKK